ncbi:MAG: EAL domain-containing protein [Deltaproteobacteria bacterium]|nr:EAL domain-containing protein [Deltaproteobacteria bacterium]
MKARLPLQEALPEVAGKVEQGSGGHEETAELPAVLGAGLFDVAETDAFLLAALMDNIPDNIYFKDSRSRFVRINLSMATYLGLDSPNDAIGQSDFDFFEQFHAEAAFRDEQEVMKNGEPLVGKDERETYSGGGVRWVSSTKLPLRDREGRIVGTFGISRDITARKNAENQLYEQAFYDPLTLLPNRALLMDRLKQLLKIGRRRSDGHFALLFLDIDRFKGINDSLGHGMGDHLLKAMARRLETCLRPGDTVARLSGDEFAILLDRLAEPVDVELVADRVHAAMQTPFDVMGTELYCSVSIGIAFADDFYKKGEDVLRDADTAMSQAKSEGRSRHVVFSSGMHDRARNLLRLETDLRRAIDRREFRVYYQPIIDIEGKRLAGFESLLRWEHPERKLVYPDEFIGLAEETGLICNIGLWSLEQACRQLTFWKQNLAVPSLPTISVNISPRQFSQPDVFEKIERVLAETGADPTLIILEITEGALMRNLECAIRLIARIRDLGIRVQIDDFGMGYSSLSQLEQMNIDGFKIDRAFVSRMGTSPKTREIVRTLVTLAKNLELSITAEGVETLEQLAEIRGFGCYKIQGFLYSRAVPIEDAELLVSRGLPPDWQF